MPLVSYKKMIESSDTLYDKVNWYLKLKHDAVRKHVSSWGTAYWDIIDEEKDEVLEVRLGDHESSHGTDIDIVYDEWDDEWDERTYEEWLEDTWPQVKGQIDEQLSRIGSPGIGAIPKNSAGLIGAVVVGYFLWNAIK